MPNFRNIGIDNFSFVFSRRGIFIFVCTIFVYDALFERRRVGRTDGFWLLYIKAYVLSWQKYVGLINLQKCWLMTKCVFQIRSDRGCYLKERRRHKLFPELS